jgi:Phosphotransferase enzyme family
VCTGQRSVIAKVLPVADTDPQDWADHRRELLAYRSGLVRAFEPLLGAPRWHGVEHCADGSLVLWLEDVGPAYPAGWTVPRLAGVARRLGTAQAALARQSRPDHAWLNRSALAEFVGAREDEDALLAPSRPFRPLPWPELAAATRVLWREAPGLVAAVERLPRTLCHFDLHPGNVLASGSGAVLVDWACVGIGPLGEDPANLVATAVLDLHLPAALLPALFRRVVAAYHQGLNDGGWSWDRAEAERAIRLALVVRFAWVLPGRGA